MSADSEVQRAHANEICELDILAGDLELLSMWKGGASRRRLHSGQTEIILTVKSAEESRRQEEEVRSGSAIVNVSKSFAGTLALRGYPDVEVTGGEQG